MADIKKLRSLVAKYQNSTITYTEIKLLFGIISELPIKKFLLIKALNTQDIRQEFYLGVIMALNSCSPYDIGLLSYIRMRALGAVQDYARKLCNYNNVYVCPKCGQYGRMHLKQCSRCGSILNTADIVNQIQELTEDICSHYFDHDSMRNKREKSLDIIFETVYDTIDDDLAKRVLVLLRDSAVYTAKNYLRTLSAILHVSTRTIKNKINKIKELVKQLVNQGVCDFDFVS